MPAKKKDVKIEQKPLKRPPVVVVVGHVDHGKTTLLDTIRNANTAAKEAGEITQSIGAYEITQANGEKITFIDTPGHEAFSAMRVRGAAIADIAVLVVAADDGIKPQTKEAIKAIQNAKIPYIVALTKIDKQPDTTKVKNQLAEEQIFLEGFGGNVSFVEVSAKKNVGIAELLELIALTAEMQESTYNPMLPGEGSIVEAKMEPKRGIIVNAIVKEGTLRLGDPIAAGRAGGKVRQLFDYLGRAIKEAVPSMPVSIIGFTELPQTGMQFKAGALRDETILDRKAATPYAVAEENTLFVIIKAGVSGALEALQSILTGIKLPKGVALKIVSATVGEITDGDIKLALTTHASVVGFQTKIVTSAENFARGSHVPVYCSNIIYDLQKILEEKLAGIRDIDAKGDLEILGVFGEKDGKKIIGGAVRKGEIRLNETFEIVRESKLIGRGRIINLQKEKADAVVLKDGDTGGLLIESEEKIRMGDHLIVRLGLGTRDWGLEEDDTKTSKSG